MTVRDVHNLRKSLSEGTDEQQLTSYLDDLLQKDPEATVHLTLDDDNRVQVDKVFIISDDNLISCSLSMLICIDEFTYRSISGKAFAR